MASSATKSTPIKNNLTITIRTFETISSYHDKSVTDSDNGNAARKMPKAPGGRALDLRQVCRFRPAAASLWPRVGFSARVLEPYIQGDSSTGTAAPPQSRESTGFRRVSEDMEKRQKLRCICGKYCESSASATTSANESRQV